MKIFTIKRLLLIHWCTKFHIDISSRLWVIALWNVEYRTHTHTQTHTQKIKFLDVLDYSDYADTNVFKKKNSWKDKFLSEQAKWNGNENNGKVVSLEINHYPFVLYFSNFLKNFFMIYWDRIFPSPGAAGV